MKQGHFGAGVDGPIESSLLNKLCGDKIHPKSHTHVTASAVPSGISRTVMPSPKRPKYRKGSLARMSILAKMGFQEGSTVQQEQAHGSEGEAIVEYDNRKDLHAELPSSLSIAGNQPEPNFREIELPFTKRGGLGKVDAKEDTLGSADDLFATYRETLLETLYVSKTALAHFTKSTLARIRANFRSSTAMNISELADFYRSRLISSRKMDLKYRDTIPRVIEKIIIQETANTREANPLQMGSGRKTIIKKKLGKDGLYPGEESFIRTWWLNRDLGETDVPSAHSPKQEMQSHLSDLRNRETQLHIVLILEILALESKIDVKGGANPPAAPLKQEQEDDESNSILTRAPMEMNKKRDLRPLLDILVDRLCIYESVSILNPTIADEARKNGESSNKGMDKLQDFCCHVILPFYLHKAPDLVKEISRKLGGPDLSPKRQINSRATASSGTKPGTAVNKHRRVIPQQPLERVLSEEQTCRQSSPPILTRSVTAPLGGSCNRASVDPSQRPCARGNLQKSQSFTNREVDLVASSRAHAAKRKKLAELAKQRNELNAAIDALKKPNRTRVGMEIMAELEKRNVERGTLRRRALDMCSSDQALGVQITATPKKGAKLGNATRKGLTLKGAITRQPEHDGELNPEESVILSSTIRDVDQRLGRYMSEVSGADTARQTICSTVQETPSRGSCRISNPLALPTGSQLLPPHSSENPCLSSHLSPIQATLSSNRFGHEDADLNQIDNNPLRMAKSQRPVIFTRLKRAEVRVESVFRDAPTIPREAAKDVEGVMDAAGDATKEASIYDSLWGADDVDELL